MIRTTITVAVDSYDPSGQLVGSTLAMRASAERHDPYELFDAVDRGLSHLWRQMTTEEISEAIAARSVTPDVLWHQLTIF